jgi:ribosomal protein S18 acetylase RimI-like enzyme
LQVRELDAMSALPVIGAIASAMLHSSPERAPVHPGDLAWWSAWRPDGSPPPRVALVEDGSAAVAAVVVDGREVVELVDPSVAASALGATHDAMEAWIETLAEPVTRLAFDGDEAAIARITARGFAPTEHGMHCFALDLTAAPPVEPGITVTPVDPDGDLEGRLRVTHAAFGVRVPFDGYVERYRAFTRSSAYPRGWDLVALDADGTPAACCIGWPDAASGVGNLEPVATHPAYLRRGFGRAVVATALARFAGAGLTRAIVVTPVENAGGVAFYRSLGFEIRGFLRSYERA